MPPKEFSASSLRNSASIPHLLIRIGVAFAFLYPPIAAFIEPDSWVGYFPGFLMGIVPDAVLLHSFGIIEVIIGLWILSGKNIFIPSVLATAMLALIIVFNFSNFDVIFRDVSIAFASLALMFLSRSASPPSSISKS